MGSRPKAQVSHLRSHFGSSEPLCFDLGGPARAGPWRLFWWSLRCSGPRAPGPSDPLCWPSFPRLRPVRGPLAPLRRGPFGAPSSLLPCGASGLAACPPGGVALGPLSPWEMETILNDLKPQDGVRGASGGRPGAIDPFLERSVSGRVDLIHRVRRGAYLGTFPQVHLGPREFFLKNTQ